MSETGDASPPAPAAAALQAKIEQGTALHQQGRLAEAERIYREVLQQQPRDFDALHLLGVVALQTRQPAQGADLIRKAISIKPNVAAAHSNLGKALLELKRPAEALASFDQAIALAPDIAMAHNNRSSTLLDLGCPEEALASCEQAIALEPGLALAHNNRGMALGKLKRFEEALASYDRAIALTRDFAEAHNNRGNALINLKRAEEALASYDRAIALMPDFAMAYCNRGDALWDVKRYADALSSYDEATALKPDYAEAYNKRGDLCIELKRYDEAFAAYDKALALEPDLAGAESDRLDAKLRLCDWRNFDSECAHLNAGVRNGNVNTRPFKFLAISSSSQDQWRCARLWIAHEFPASQTPAWQGERYDHERIRVGYVSADFRRHATSFLMAGMFECHDKSRFDVTAISIGANDNSEMRRRLEASFDRFIDGSRYSDKQIADLVRSLEIDLLVDLKGFTAESRTGIFARRPAPLQINYLGYPGTMGAEYIDYIIADRILIPQSEQEFYAEKIAYLPNSYQVNDAKRSIVDKVFTRTELGLPPAGFIFCCFNNNFKITPSIFDLWMRMLKQVDGSVLWLLEDNAKAASNLRKEAVARGVRAERLVFAQRLPLAEHLARHRSADLFLDTLPCNAHTTASDALWAGLPVLTCLGETFAGRVAASLLNAIGLPELVTPTLEAYEQTAVDLAMHRERLAAIKRKLAENRLTAPLFDTRLFTRHIEAAYTAMHERHQAGLPPDHITIAN